MDFITPSMAQLIEENAKMDAALLLFKRKAAAMLETSEHGIAPFNEDEINEVMLVAGKEFLRINKIVPSAGERICGD